MVRGRLICSRKETEKFAHEYFVTVDSEHFVCMQDFKKNPKRGDFQHKAICSYGSIYFKRHNKKETLSEGCHHVSKETRKMWHKLSYLVLLEADLKVLGRHNDM